MDCCGEIKDEVATVIVDKLLGGGLTHSAEDAAFNDVRGMDGTVDVEGFDGAPEDHVTEVLTGVAPVLEGSCAQRVGHVAEVLESAASKLESASKLEFLEHHRVIKSLVAAGIGFAATGIGDMDDTAARGGHVAEMLECANPELDIVD